MKHFTQKTRKLLRAIYMTVGAGVVSLVFQACYGVPPAVINGEVLDGNTKKPIPGIKVSPEDSGDYHEITDSNGKFSMYLYNSTIVLIFEDIDGPLNGSYQQKTVKFSDKDTQKKLTVLLQEQNEE